MSQPQPPLAQALERALAAHRAGELGQAAGLYRNILAQHPGEPNSLRLLGLIAFQHGRAEEAVRLVSESVRHDPRSAESHWLLGQFFMRQRQPERALASLQSCVAIDPGHPNALLALGNLHVAAGRTAKAIEWLRRAATANPNSADIWSSLGRAQHALARYDEALGAYERALSLSPRNVEVIANRGAALIKLERFEEALAAIDQALALVGDNPQIWFNRGLVQAKIGRWQEAAAAYDRAIGLKPDQPEFWQNRGSALQRLEDAQGTLDSFDRVLALRPNDAEAFNGRASALNSFGRFDEALIDVDRAIETDPGHANAHGTRGSILFNLYRAADAIASYRRAAELEPDNPSHHSNLIFALNFDPSLTVADHQAERARFEERFGRPLAARIRPHDNDPDPDRRLRIGYVSGDFRHQAAAYSFGGVIINHDRECFDVVCYSDTRQEDDVTEKLRARADTWHNIAALSDARLAELVRADRIDILVDLVGHMAGNRLVAFARKPAPVQVTSWGEQNGTGLTAIDYFLADPVLAPERYRPLLAEKTVDLLNFAAYWTPDLLPEPSPLPALSRGHVTFGSFNRLLKLQEQTVACWSKILKSVPRSRLVLKEPRLAEEHQRRRVQAMFAAHGIVPDWLTLLPGTDRFNHFLAYHGIDIALDPLPHGGGITTLDALWMGVPVVTTPGPTLSSRQAAACLTTVGATDFIAEDHEAYVGVAVERARDLDALARMRGSLRQRMFDSGISDLPRYARGVEQAYRTMWRTWCERQAGRS